ncbi:MAG TPA: D-alanyl-D-alanine carboxypeptidase [Xanthobacteraceae bacterium]
MSCVRVRSSVAVGFRGVLGLAAGVALLAATNNSAGAYGYHRYYRHASRASAEVYAPPFASIVVDGNTGDVLHASNADGPRHPASLTKIMTLYLLFERLDAGKIRLDSQLRVSAHASEQAPTKLGLKPGQTIAVEDAIKAVVTKSANDAAVTIAENLGGDESAFAELMTQKAHALGMSRTTYVNASGLPDDAQVTTARDQALLGRAIQERFPRYYKYFSTEQFVYHGSAMRNHNHLLGVVGGVDGIKTGYTRASGFNLVTSMHRDGRYIIAVVLGGRSAGERDAYMRELIGTHIREASLQRTPATTEKLASRGEFAARNEVALRSAVEAPAAAKVVQRSRSEAAVSTAAAEARASLGSSEPIHPVLVRTVTYRTAPPQTGSLAPMPVMVPTSGSPAQGGMATANRRIAATEPAQDSIVVASTEPPVVATTLKTEPPKTDLAREEPVSVPPSTSPHARGGWLIQVGAYEAESEARQHLNAAQLKIPGILASADPFTERVQKGEKTYYRARFVGLDKPAAEAACKLLKRSEIECMAVKN